MNKKDKDAKLQNVPLSDRLKAAQALPCDGVARYTVRNLRGLTFSQALATIRAESKGSNCPHLEKATIARTIMLKKMHKRFLA
jgi:hypothetical protein